MTERRIQPWTPEEDERLRKLAGEGRAVPIIAERLKRSPHSVRNRAKVMGVKLPKVKEK
jgi:DNA-binding NarL/FixJ family response regulator